MKKNIFLIALAAAAVGCSNDEVIEPVNTKQVAIGFSTEAIRSTRAEGPTASDLEYYHKTFAVYGTKKAATGGAVSYVFGGDATSAAGQQAGVTCTFDAGGADITGYWKYSPARYWDTQATYSFIAYAPASANMKYYYAAAKAEVGATSNKFQSTATVTLTGQNLQMPDATNAEKNKGFDGTTKNDSLSDIDIMISDLEKDIKGSEKQEVTLKFKHTFSKLIVKMKAGADDKGYTVKVKEIKVENYYAQGDFNKNDASNKWIADTTGSKVNYVFKKEVGDTLGTTDTYFIESLVMPQNVSADQKVTIVYDLTTGTGDDIHTETFTHTTDMKEIMGDDGPTAYDGGNSYDIGVTVDPSANVIKFDATVAAWSETEKVMPLPKEDDTE